MTKIMTAIVALENISNLDDKVMLTGEDFLGLEEANASVAGFKEGDVVTYRDLCCFIYFTFIYYTGSIMKKR